MSGFAPSKFQFLTTAGAPNASGVIHVYQTGTTTPVTIYNDGALTSPASNPLTLDSNGVGKFYVAVSADLRIDSYTSTGGFIETIDPVFVVGTAIASANQVTYVSTNFNLTPAQANLNIIATAPLTITLPATTTFSNTFQTTLNAQGGAITLSPNGTDKINGVNASFTLQTGSSAVLWTDAIGNWGLNFLLSTIVPNNISGLLPSSIAGSSTTASMTVSVGVCSDSANAVMMKGAGYSWAASHGNAINGTDAASSTLAITTTYHMFLCSGSSGTGTFASASLTPTFPGGYQTSKRRIFSFNTDGSGSPIFYSAFEAEGGSFTAWWGIPVLDMSGVSVTTTANLNLMSVPAGIRVEWLGRITSSATGNGTLIVTSPDESDIAPPAISGGVFAFAAAPGDDLAAGTAGSTGNILTSGFLTTNTAAQIRTRAATNTQTVYAVTRGWKDYRRS